MTVGTKHCQRCGKQRFETPQDAHRVVEGLLSAARITAGKRSKKSRKAKVYWSEECGTYHITSHDNDISSARRRHVRGRIRGR